MDRDVTLPVACRSTFIAVIQPRIERPTAERRNGNTQWFSCEPVGTRIDRFLREEGRVNSWQKDQFPPSFFLPPGQIRREERVFEAKRNSFVPEQKKEEEREKRLASWLEIIERSRSSVVRKFVGRDLRFLPRNRIFDSRMK